MYLFSLMDILILGNLGKIVRNVVLIGNTKVHLKIVIIHFILNSLLTKHNKTSSFCIRSIFQAVKDDFLVVVIVFDIYITIYNYIGVIIKKNL